MEQREKTTELNYFENPRYVNKPKKFVAEDGNYMNILRQRHFI